MRRFAFLLAGGALLAAPVSFAARGTAGAGAAAGPPDVKALRVPAGHKLLFTAQAAGVQIYVSKPGKGGKFEWEFKAPLAGLSAKGKEVGYHYAGPSWEATDGSKVVLDKSEEVAKSPAPRPREDIPWLRLKVRADGGAAGLFGRVTYVQRVETRGGQPPARRPVRAGTEVGVRYTATYHFYGPAE
jgi:hypothetical protein